MVKWTRHARTQLREIFGYIARDSRFYARRVAEALVSRTEGLDEAPRRGRVVPELNLDTVRELPEYSWRILYEIRSEASPAHVEILAVIHKRRDLQAEEIPRGE
ncbi:MAG: type II toxin-antitoxin system RelE/ParE family toxin [Nitrospiraceae bacterium]